MKKKTERFQVLNTIIDGVFILDRNLYCDHRGSFSRLLCEDEMGELNLNASISQINISKTDQIGTIRGMHFQSGAAAEDKYVICLKGSVFDVALDIRKDSKTYLKWDGVTLSATENKMIYIPKGVAHGFQALENDCWLLYLHTEKYSPKAEMGHNPLDPRLSIKWPISNFEMSDKDLNRKYI
tara:strand:- start:916 stop:1461 length:546 start_codon:yes stop_codon:yes gene_type:complete